MSASVRDTSMQKGQVERPTTTTLQAGQAAKASRLCMLKPGCPMFIVPVLATWSRISLPHLFSDTAAASLSASVTPA